MGVPCLNPFDPDPPPYPPPDPSPTLSALAGCVKGGQGEGQAGYLSERRMSVADGCTTVEKLRILVEVRASSLGWGLCVGCGLCAFMSSVLLGCIFVCWCVCAVYPGGGVCLRLPWLLAAATSDVPTATAAADAFS